MAHRILLVDDEKDLLELVKVRLEANGFDVMTARDGLEALEKARGEKPDLVILDVMLPKLNGYEVCTLLKQDPRYQNIPIVLFTAKTQEEDEKTGVGCGANAYVRKPFQPQELLEKIRSLLPVVN